MGDLRRATGSGARRALRAAAGDVIRALVDLERARARARRELHEGRPGVRSTAAALRPPVGRNRLTKRKRPIEQEQHKPDRLKAIIRNRGRPIPLIRPRTVGPQKAREPAYHSALRPDGRRHHRRGHRANQGVGVPWPLSPGAARRVHGNAALRFRVPTPFVQKYTVRTRPEPPVLSHFVALDRAPDRLRGPERQVSCRRSTGAEDKSGVGDRNDPSCQAQRSFLP